MERVFPVFFFITNCVEISLISIILEVSSVTLRDAERVVSRNPLCAAKSVSSVPSVVPVPLAARKRDVAVAVCLGRFGKAKAIG